MLQKEKISVIIPCFNEEEGIKNVLGKMPDYIDEVIVVDNNSTDNTSFVAKKSKAIIVFEREKGYGAAIKAGLKKAKGDILVVLDGDDTYPPECIKDLVKYLQKNNLNFVSANRFDKKYASSMPGLNFLGNTILTYAFKLLFSYHIQDSQSGMFCLKKSLLPQLHLQSTGMSFSEEIKLAAIQYNQKKFAEYPIPYHDHHRVGKKKLHLWRDGLDNLVFLMKKKMNT